MRRFPFSLDPLMAEAKRRMRRRRVWIAASLILAGGVTAAMASIAPLGGPGSTGGGPGVHGLLSQMRSSFGDHRLLSASVNGLTLTVKVAAHDEPSAVSATFEAQILASALHDAQAARGQTPIDSVDYVDARGKAIPGYGAARVGTDTAGHPLPTIGALAKGACDSAAHAAQAEQSARVSHAPLAVRSVLTLPHASGACAFKFQIADPSTFAAPLDTGKLATTMGDPNERAFLVEVDDQAGVPQFVDDYTPGGGGVAYVKPGSGILFGP